MQNTRLAKSIPTPSRPVFAAQILVEPAVQFLPQLLGRCQHCWEASGVQG